MDQELVIRAGTTEAAIRPAAGAVVTRFTVAGRSVLFPDAMLEVGGKPRRRGGSPLLFPQAGPLPADAPYALPSHGFARTEPWAVSAQTERSVSLALTVDAAAYPEFPFSLDLEFQVSVEEGVLSQRLVVVNRSDRPVPVAPGFHPYFAISAASLSSLELNLPGIDLSTYRPPETIFLGRTDPIQAGIDGSQLRISSSDQFKVVAVWTEPGRDFICLEPWVGLEGALTGPGAVLVAPGGHEVFTMDIAVS